MGKNYSKNGYRKSYEGDYTKEYQNETLVKKINAERKRSYDLVSKKIGTTTYDKGEKSPYDAKVSTENTGKVINVHPSRIDVKPSTQNYKKQERNVAKRETKPIITAQQPKETIKHNKTQASDIPPPFHTAEDKVNKAHVDIPRKKQAPRKNQYDLSYIDVKSTKLPIEKISNNEYIDTYTGEKLDVYGARKRLEYAGFTQNSLFPTPVTIFLILFGLFFPLMGPIMLYTVGNGLRKRTNTLFVKNINTAQAQRFEMPLSKQELEGFKSKRAVFVVAAILAAIFQIYTYYRV